MSKNLQALLDQEASKPKRSSYIPTDTVKSNIGNLNKGKKLAPQSAETRAKRSKALKGRARSAEDLAKIKAGRLAKGGWASPSAETRAKLRDANLGKKYSAETCAKRSVALKGKKRSDETKAKQSAASVGKPKSDAHREALSIAAKKRHARARAERAAKSK